jgi:hypothetical protein
MLLHQIIKFQEGVQVDGTLHYAFDSFSIELTVESQIFFFPQLPRR